jgi:hypothetical protein
MEKDKLTHRLIEGCLWIRLLVQQEFTQAAVDREHLSRLGPDLFFGISRKPLKSSYI